MRNWILLHPDMGAQLHYELYGWHPVHTPGKVKLMTLSIRGCYS